MVKFVKKLCILTIILFVSIISTSCNRTDKSSFFNVASVKDTPTKVIRQNTKNVVYLGDSEDARPFGPKDVSFDFYDLKR